MKRSGTISAAPESGLRHLNPVGLLSNLYSHRSLIRQFARRDIQARYRGTFLGLFWSVLVPLGSLAVYAFVFGVVFSARWGVRSGESGVDFALALFCGLIWFNIFGECVSRAPDLILRNPNYVKKVVFPLEILPVATLAVSLFSAGISLVILLVATVALGPSFSSTLWLFPLSLFPLVAFSLGLTWFLASLGVFVRDIAHPVGIGVQMLMFMSGIFYSPSAVPAAMQPIMKWNPLVMIIENARRTVVWGEWPEWFGLVCLTLLSLLFLQAGYFWFMKSKRAFADVI